MGCNATKTTGSGELENLPPNSLNFTLEDRNETSGVQCVPPNE